MQRLVDFRNQIYGLKNIVSTHATDIDDEQTHLWETYYQLSIATSLIDDMLQYAATVENPEEQTLEKDLNDDSINIDVPSRGFLDWLHLILRKLNVYLLHIIEKEKYSTIVPSRYLSQVEQNINEAKYNVEYEIQRNKEINL